MSVIDWYEHDDDHEHTIHHVYYGSVNRMPAESYYGYEPPEGPDPRAECAHCGEDVYTDDYMVDGEIVCPVCGEYWNSRDIAMDFARVYPESTIEFLKAAIDCDWFEEFAEDLKEFYRDEMLDFAKTGKKEETPHGSATPLK